MSRPRPCHDLGLDMTSASTLSRPRSCRIRTSSRLCLYSVLISFYLLVIWNYLLVRRCLVHRTDRGRGRQSEAEISTPRTVVRGVPVLGVPLPGTPRTAGMAVPLRLHRGVHMPERALPPGRPGQAWLWTGLRPVLFVVRMDMSRTSSPTRSSTYPDIQPRVTP